MRKKSIVSILLIFLLFMISGCSANQESMPDQTVGDTITITDCAGRNVEIPKTVEKIGCMYAYTAQVVTMLGRGDDIAAVVPGTKREVLLREICPSIMDAPVTSVSGIINIEEMAKVNPDVVFVKSEISSNEKELAKLDEFNIPYLVVDFNSIAEQKYSIKMIGQAIGASDEAEKFNQYYQECIDRVQEKVKDIPMEERVRVYHSVNEAVRTDAKNTLPGDWTQVAGAYNVSVNENLHFAENKYFASLEQILLWDPEVIIVNEEGVDEYMMANEQWANIKAVREHKVYKMPNGISRWGHPGGIETPLAILWTAHKLYPNRFNDIDIKSETQYFYKEFFDHELSAEMLQRMMSGEGMREAKQ